MAPVQWNPVERLVVNRRRVAFWLAIKVVLVKTACGSTVADKGDALRRVQRASDTPIFPPRDWQFNGFRWAPRLSHSGSASGLPCWHKPLGRRLARPLTGRFHHDGRIVGRMPNISASSSGLPPTLSTDLDRSRTRSPRPGLNSATIARRLSCHTLRRRRGSLQWRQTPQPSRHRARTRRRCTSGRNR